MSDCATCARAKRKNRLLKKLADELDEVTQFVNSDDEYQNMIRKLLSEARKEAGR